MIGGKGFKMVDVVKEWGVHDFLPARQLLSYLQNTYKLTSSSRGYRKIPRHVLKGGSRIMLGIIINSTLVGRELNLFATFTRSRDKSKQVV